MDSMGYTVLLFKTYVFIYIYGQSLLKNDVVRMYVAVIYSQGSKFRQWKLRLACSDLGV